MYSRYIIVFFDVIRIDI